MSPYPPSSQMRTTSGIRSRTAVSISWEFETAVRERIPLVVLIWEDGGYGLIEWKMDLELGEHHYVKFNNPDVVTYAESFGAKGYRITAADQLSPTLRTALADD